MRQILIDAMELKKILPKFILDEAEAYIDETQEIEAIPIEWLHSIMEKQLIFAMNSEMEGTTTVQDGVIHCVSGALACQVLANVIELWEKENTLDKQIEQWEIDDDVDWEMIQNGEITD